MAKRVIAGDATQDVFLACFSALPCRIMRCPAPRWKHAEAVGGLHRNT